MPAANITCGMCDLFLPVVRSRHTIQRWKGSEIKWNAKQYMQACLRLVELLEPECKFTE